jgi:hypothetical protein
MNEILSLKDVVIEYDRKGEKVRAVAGVDLGQDRGRSLDWSVNQAVENRH